MEKIPRPILRPAIDGSIRVGFSSLMQTESIAIVLLRIIALLVSAYGILMLLAVVVFSVWMKGPIFSAGLLVSTPLITLVSGAILYLFSAKIGNCITRDLP
jgi:hypothetical protein